MAPLKLGALNFAVQCCGGPREAGGDVPRPVKIGRDRDIGAALAIKSGCGPVMSPAAETAAGNFLSLRVSDLAADRGAAAVQEQATSANGPVPAMELPV